MTISDEKVRTMITLEKKDKAMLEKIAEYENRSLNNLMETVLKAFITKEQS